MKKRILDFGWKSWRNGRGCGLFAGVLLGCVACGEKEDPDNGQEETPPNTVAEEAAPAAPVTTDNMPPRAAPVSGSLFDTTTAQLDLGGEVFAYRELEGSAEALAETLTELLALVPENERPPQLTHLNASALAKDLGLTKISAAGISSLKVGDRYLNKLYVHTPRGRDGLLRLLGRDSAPFAASTIAPKGSDLVLERELNLSEAYRIGRDVIKNTMGPEAEKQWQAEMGKALGNVGVGLADLFGKLDARITLIIRFNEAKQLTVPGPNGGPMEIPQPEIFVALDGLPFLFDKLIESLPPEAADAVQEGDGYKELALPPNPLVDGMVLRHLAVGDRIVLAGPSPFLAECLAGDGGLFASAEYKKATAGLPTEGNGMLYLGEGVSALLGQLIAQAGESSGMPTDLRRRATNLLTQLLPLTGSYYAGVSVNSKSGLLNVSNSPASWKQAATMGATVPLTTAIFWTKSSTNPAPVKALPLEALPPDTLRESPTELPR